MDFFWASTRGWKYHILGDSCISNHFTLHTFSYMHQLYEDFHPKMWSKFKHPLSPSLCWSSIFQFDNLYYISCGPWKDCCKCNNGLLHSHVGSKGIDGYFSRVIWVRVVMISQCLRNTWQLIYLNGPFALEKHQLNNISAWIWKKAKHRQLIRSDLLVLIKSHVKQTDLWGDLQLLV